MVKYLKVAGSLAIAVVLALVVGAGALFALNHPVPGVAADAVAVLKSQGVTCGSCAGKIEKALKEKPGVASVEVEVDAGRVNVAYDSKVVKPETLAETVSGLGYGSSVMQVISADQYRATTGRDLPVQAAKAGCACCNKKNN